MAAFVGLAAMAAYGANSGSLTTSLLKQAGAFNDEHSPTETQAPDKSNTPISILRVAEPSQRDITGGETQVLKVALLKGQFAQVAFEWRGMDLDGQVRGPNEVGSNRPNFHVRGSGSLPVALIANVDGDYSLIVRPTENATITGRYGVVLEIVSLPEPTDQKRVDAQNLIAQADREQSPGAATEKLQQALQLWSEIGDRHGIAQTLQLLGQKHLTTDARAPSKPGGTVSTTGDEYYRRSIEIAQNGSPSQFAYTLLDIGSDYEIFSSPKKALDYYQRALQRFRETGDRRGEATALFSLGLAETKIGDLSEHKALRWYEPALAISRSENDRLLEARTLNGIGGVYGILADQSQALSRYQEAEVILKELNDVRREAITIKNIGLVYDDLGDLQTAKDRYLQSLSLHTLQLTTKNLDSCKGKIAAEDTRLCNSIAHTMDNVGELYNTLGESQLALNTLRDGLAIRGNLKQPQGIGATLSRIAYAHLLQNEPTEALKYCDLALPYSRKADDLRKTGSILTFIGMAKAALNQPDEALEYYRQALSLQEKTGELRGKGITLDQMGRAYALNQDVERAIENYQSALSIWQQIKDQEWEPRTIYNLAIAEQDRGNIAGAQQQIERAIQVVEARRGTLSSLQLRTSYFANKEDIYKLDVDLKMQMGKRANHDRYVASALETSDKTRARTLVDTLSEANLSRKLGDCSNPQADRRLAELSARRQLLQGQINSKGQFQMKLLSGKHTQEQADAINKEIGELTNEYDALMTQVTAINPRYAALIKPVPLTASEIQQQLDDNTLLLEYALGVKRSYVWVVTPKSIEGFQLAPRAEIERVARRVTEALTARNREEKDESFPQRHLRLEKAQKEYVEASTALSKMILEPVASLLGQKRLIVIGDGALQMVPFAALPDPAISATPNSAIADDSKLGANSSRPTAPNPATLISAHEIIPEPSASVLVLQRRELANRKPAPLAVAVLADPVFDLQDARVARAPHNRGQGRKDTATTGQGGMPLTKPSAQNFLPISPADKEHLALTTALRDVGLDPENMPRLSLSRQEAEAIRRAVSPGEFFSALDFKASRQTATSPELSKYRIIHFATHGVLDLEHPELSGIVLSMVDEKGQPQDGYLRLHDIYNLNLPAELIVLSACQTGIGKQIKGEGLIALTRGFMYAGAKSIVASLWKVDDQATSELMAEFYKQMFMNKLRPAAALRVAQINLSKNKRWQSPYYWAGFFLQGEWN